MNKPKLVFYFPYRGVGGVSVLFLRLANLLSNRYELYLVDYDDGYMRQNLPKNCRFISVENPERIPQDATVVFQSTALWRIPYVGRFPKGCKVLFWNLHPQNFQSNYLSSASKKWYLRFLNSFVVLRRRKLRDYVEFLQERSAIVFMDGENYTKTKSDLKLNSVVEIYVPILTESPKVCGILKCDSSLKALWIGRLEDFKVEILKRTLIQLDTLNDLKVSFTIIGSGQAEQELGEFVFSHLQQLEVEFRGACDMKELDQAILDCDVVFAMGTSALDAAKLYKPVISLDYSYTPVPEEYQFHMLYTNKYFNVAEEISAKHIKDESNLAELLKNVLQHYSDEAQACYDYWQKNHSEIAVARFVKALSATNCTIGELLSYRFDKPDIMTSLLNVGIKTFKRRHKDTDINII